MRTQIIKTKHRFMWRFSNLSQPNFPLRQVLNIRLQIPLLTSPPLLILPPTIKCQSNNYQNTKNPVDNFQPLLCQNRFPNSKRINRTSSPILISRNNINQILPQPQTILRPVNKLILKIKHPNKRQAILQSQLFFLI